jgi:probable poly-beta-1,6-N-acetyl-D-glucosamine export protein
VNNKKYDVAVDGLRVVAILAVVMIHVTTKMLQMHGGDVVGHPVTLILNQISRFAVPLFFMMSGYVLELSHKDESYFKYLKRRVNKILVPYVFWSLVYGLIIYPQNIASLPRLLIFGGAAYQLYFIPAILVFYVIFPVIHKTVKFIDNRWVMWGLLLIQMGFLYRDYYIKPWGVPESVKIPFLAFWVFLTGIVAARNKYEMIKFLDKYKRLITIATGVLALCVFWEGRAGFLTTNNYYMYYSQWRPSVVAYTLAVAASLYYLFNKLNWINRWVTHLAQMSFFVFFVHVLLLEKMGPNFLVVTGVAFGLGCVVHQVSYLKKIQSFVG